MTLFFVEDPFYAQEKAHTPTMKHMTSYFDISEVVFKTLKPALKIIIAFDFRIIQIIIVNLQMKI